MPFYTARHEYGPSALCAVPVVSPAFAGSLLIALTHGWIDGWMDGQDELTDWLVTYRDGYLLTVTYPSTNRV